MSEVTMREEIDHHRRLFGDGALALAAQFGMIRSVATQSIETKPIPSTAISTSFSSLKQVDAGVLSIGYSDVDPASGPVAILLHGWPYDIHSYVEAAPLSLPPLG